MADIAVHRPIFDPPIEIELKYDQMIRLMFEKMSLFRRFSAHVKLLVTSFQMVFACSHVLISFFKFRARVFYRYCIYYF